METSMFRILGDSRHIPDIEEDPKGWNQAWCGYLDQLQPGNDKSQVRQILLPPKPLDRGPVSETTIRNLDLQRKSARGLQEGIGLHILQHLDFEEKWKGYSKSRRETLILRALVESCTPLALLEDRRDQCPETTMLYLQKDGGQGFLDLVHAVLPKSPEKSTRSSTGCLNPTFVPHPVIDPQFGFDKKPDEIHPSELSLSLRRTFFLSYFVLNTLYAMEGKKGETVLAKSYEDRKPEQYLKEHGPALKEKGYDPTVVNKQFDERDQMTHFVCGVCGTTERELDGKKLLFCGACKSLGRQVRYCSKQCQVKDWKQGNPPHKNLCGKPLPSY